jgi:hypothetical protein
MVFRNDVEALRSRVRALDAEVIERTRERNEVTQMLQEAQGRGLDPAAPCDLVPRGRPRPRRELARLAVVIFVLALSGSALGDCLANHERSARNARAERKVERFSALVDEICRCTDTACVARMSSGFATWSADLVAGDLSSSKLDPESVQRVIELRARMRTCMIAGMAPRPLLAPSAEP